ncbi:hypothetical protein L3Q82_004185 [Scortum barcoo]|uniref:Uncharacterized protein n=1 Tax=Scortum barcoo TaxID=214431 RepID=A0ACB8VIX0_9TELE|nr:hypothetical protein L3Q82_004185 [Scortum barcoo]
MLERLCLSAGLGTPLRVPTGRAGGSVWGPGRRGSSLSRDAQTSLTPDTSSSSFRGDPEVFPGQLRDIVSSVSWVFPVRPPSDYPLPMQEVVESPGDHMTTTSQQIQHLPQL